MKKYTCQSCWYTYDPAVGDPKAGIAPGTAFEDIPEDWFCPICMRDKSAFKPEEEVKIEGQTPFDDDLDRYRCKACWYIYDPRLGDPVAGIAPGTAFEDLPEDWFCPICMLTKDSFIKVTLTDKIAKSIVSGEPVNPNTDLARYKCKACFYTYDPRVGDPKAGVAPGTAFEDLPEDWFCPICMMTKDYFEREGIE